MLVKIPHGLNAKHVFNVAFDSDVIDNSDISEHNSKGRYYRQTFGMYVDDGYLWRSSVTNVPMLEDLKFSMYDGKITDEMTNVIDFGDLHEILNIDNK